MGVISFVFRRKTVYKLRKEYDRLRENADRDGDMNRKLAVLRYLDQIEPTLVALEEQMLSGFERKRMMKYVSDSIRKIKKMTGDDEYFSDMLGEKEGNREKM